MPHTFRVPSPPSHPPSPIPVSPPPASYPHAPHPPNPATHLGDVFLADPVEAEMTEIERSGAGLRPTCDDEVGDLWGWEWSLRAVTDGRGLPPPQFPRGAPISVPPGRGRQQRRREKQSSPARSEQSCRAARRSRTLGKDRPQPSSMTVPARSSMGNFRRRKPLVPGAWSWRRQGWRR